MGKGDTGKSRDDDCNGFAYLPAPAAKTDSCRERPGVWDTRARP